VNGVVKIGAEKVIGRKGVYSSRVSDDLVLFDEDLGKYFATGMVGADIWELIETPQSIDEICTTLMERYDVDEETCREEVLRFVEELISAGLATEGQPEGPGWRPRG
jgi:hypothetical protein